MPILDDAGNPITLSGLVGEAPPSEEVQAEAIADDPAQELEPAELADAAGLETADTDDDSPEAPAFDPDDEETNPYVARARDLEARLEAAERAQREQDARQQQADITQAQQRRLQAQQQLLAKSRELDPDKLTDVVLPQVIQMWNAEVAALAQQSVQTVNQVQWDREIERIAKEENLTEDEAKDVHAAADSAQARDRAKQLVRTRTQYDQKIKALEKKIVQQTAARRDTQASERQASGAERVGGSGIGAAPAAQALSPLQILRQEITGNPNTPIRVGG